MARSRLLANIIAAINGVPIGGTTPAAGAFTTLGASGAVTLAGTTALNGPINVNGAASVAGQIIRSAGPSVPAAWGAPLVSGAAVTTTSGTVVDFTGIPAWAKRITVMFNGVSTNGVSAKQVQLGTSAGFAVAGYAATSSGVGTGVATVTSTTGLVVYAVTAADLLSGAMVITNVSGNAWVASFAGKTSTATSCFGGGDVTLAGVLDRIRITTVNGTDTFDAGSINIMWE